jgi:hypothetical protein
MIDLEKHKANFRIIHRFDEETGKWWYRVQHKWLWIWWDDWGYAHLKDAEERLRQKISQNRLIVVKELYAK